MTIFYKLILKIISEQENIIGPLAIEQAQKVNGLILDWQKKEILIKGNEKLIVRNLISQYEKIFGQASVEVCNEIINSMKINLSS